MGVKLPVQNYFTRADGPSEWVRPSDWPVITDAVNEVQFLMSDLGDSNCSIQIAYTRTSGTQNIIIDWGDGTTNTISTNTITITNHTYASGTGTPCSLGYTTFKIRIYFTGTGVSSISTCKITAVLIAGNTSMGVQNCAVLEAYFGDGTLTLNSSMNALFYSNISGGLSSYQNLNYVKLPTSGNWTLWGSSFAECRNLYKVIMPTSNPNATQYATTFSNCNSLQEITYPSNSTLITTLSGTFTACYSLKKVTLPSTLNSLTSFSQTFYLCRSLKNITIPSVNINPTFNTAFYNCDQLEWVKFISLPTVASIDFTQIFERCFNLQNVYFPTTCTSTSVYNTLSSFNNCYQLKSIVFPSNMNVSTLQNTFQNCYSLITCILPNSTPNCTAMNNMFSYCFSLMNVTLPTTVGSTINMLQSFYSCLKLQTLTIPSSYNITNLNSTLHTCISLKNLNWVPGIQNSLTDMSSTFSNCLLLDNITMPTSMTTLTSLLSTFIECTALTSIRLPSSLNAVTNMGNCFQLCVNLKSVILPKSMSSCVNLNGVFTSCTSIKSITLPNIVSTSITTFANAFANCMSLNEIILPGNAQLSSVTSIQNIFNSCQSLITITNFEKIGSLTATPLINSSTPFAKLILISFVGPLSTLNLQGNTSTSRTDVQSIRLLNTSAGQWTGASPQINVSNTNMSTANLVQLFTDMAAQGNVTSKTINITTATGTAGLTAANRLLITSKGWTITG